MLVAMRRMATARGRLPLARLVSSSKSPAVRKTIAHPVGAGPAKFTVSMVPALDDNYIFLVETPGGSKLVVDPGQSDPVIRAAEELGWMETGGIDGILITHHHADHVDGNLELKKKFPQCVVVGPDSEANPIPGLDVVVKENFDLSSTPLFSGSPIGDVPHIIDTPGHTHDHISYVFGNHSNDEAATVKDGPLLFCGDTIFSLGCGRLFEGTPADMFDSLQKLKALPTSTTMYCAHEYSADNARFTMDVAQRLKAIASVIPPSSEGPLYRRAAAIEKDSRTGNPTLPVRLGEELITNVFLLAKTPEDFATLRKMKDTFSSKRDLKSYLRRRA